MSASPTLAIIGGGRMGEAIATGLVSSGTLRPDAIIVAEPSESRRSVFGERGIRTVEDGGDAVAGTEVVLLAVKPQVVDAVVGGLADRLPPDAIIISIAAGIPTARLESLLPAETAVVRVMPNTPAMVGAGMAVVSAGRWALPAQVERVCALFEAVGRAVVVDESAQDAATAISGSGPAYVALFVDALTQAGTVHGLAPEVARQLAIETLRGTAELLVTSGIEPCDLIEGVSSPGGTTVAALQALEAGGFAATVLAAVTAAVDRAKELGA